MPVRDLGFFLETHNESNYSSVLIIFPQPSQLFVGKLLFPLCSPMGSSGWVVAGNSIWRVLFLVVVVAEADVIVHHQIPV